MRSVRYILWGVVAVAAVALFWGYLSGSISSNSLNQAGNIRLGGEFQLTRHNGTPISDKDLTGKPHAIFFGFTNCPEICPTTLYEMSLWLKELGKDAGKLGVYFVSVDPERDQPEFLSEYLTSFDPQIIGITGEKTAIEKTLRAYKVYFKKVPFEDGDYTMDHTATIYLLNANGEFVRSISYGEVQSSAVAKLRKLIAGK